jgi:predicted dehydrogenase
MPCPPEPFGSYQELLDSRSVDAVYIPLPTGLRKEWVLRAAAARKHIVCEKPCAISVADLQEMIEACRRQRVQFLDGVMFMHSRRLQQVRAALDDAQAVGSIRRITSAFTFAAPPEFFGDNIRGNASLEPHGCLGDLGWYCLRFSLWAMDWKLPMQVAGTILGQHTMPNDSDSVLTEFSGELLFEQNVSAGFFCSFLAHNQEWALVSGTKGYLRIDDFVVPFNGQHNEFAASNLDFVKDGCEFKMQPHVRRYSVEEFSQAHPTAQESNLFRQFTNQVRSGSLNSDWPEWSLKTQAVMGACLKAAREDAPVLLSVGLNMNTL